MDVDEILRRVVDNNNTTADVVRAEIGKALLDGKRSPAQPSGKPSVTGSRQWTSMWKS